MPDVPLTIAFDEETAVLAVSGDVDADATEALRQAISDHSAEYTRALTVDLSGTTYLPSVAIGALVRAGQAFDAAGASLELVAAAGSVAERVLTVSAMPHRSS